MSYTYYISVQDARLPSSLRAQRSNLGDWAELLVVRVRRVARSTVPGPLGCFGVIRLAMTRVEGHLRSLRHVPREGGDPVGHVQAVRNDLYLRLRGEHGKT
jgi:hypothetical protein